MRNVVKILAAVSIAASTFAGSVYAGSYYEGVDQNFPRGAIRSQTDIDRVETGSVHATSANHASPKSKGGEGEYYSGIQRN